MAALRETIRRSCADRGYELPQALFLCAVCAFFFFLPLRTDATATIVLMTVLAIWAGKKTGSFSRLRSPGAAVPLLGFAAFILVALVASLLNPPTLAKFPRILLWGCCVFSGAMLTAAVPRAGGAYYWALFAAIAGSFCAAVLILGYGAPEIWHDGRLKLYAIHPSRLGLYCAICFFYLLYRSFMAAGREKLLSIAAALFILFVLVKTNTRGNLLMLPLGVVCLGACLPRRYWKRLGFALLLCAVLAGGALWAYKDTFTGRRLVSAVTNVRQDANFISRLPIWEAGWDAFKQAPAIGHGHQSYLALHTRYLEMHKEELDARFSQGYEHRVKQAHNLILGRLVETGLLGTLAFLVFYCGAAIAAWRGPEERRWLVAPLVFYMAMSMLDDGLFRMNDAFILFIAGTALTSGKPVRRADSALLRCAGR